MKTTRTARAIALLGAAVLLLGCPGAFVPRIDFLGKQVPVEDTGHFKEDLIYLDGAVTISYGADGSYEYAEAEYEDTSEDTDGDGTAGEGWVITDGRRGTYTYDPETMVISVRLTHEVSLGEFGPLADVDMTTEAATMFFGEHKLANAYLIGEGTGDWVRTWSTVNSDGSREETGSVVNFGDGVRYGMSLTSLEFDAAGVQTGGTQVETGGFITIIPYGTVFHSGVTVTCRLLRTSYRSLSWNGSDWEPLAENRNQVLSYVTYTHMGTFIIQEGETSFR